MAENGADTTWPNTLPAKPWAWCSSPSRSRSRSSFSTTTLPPPPGAPSPPLVLSHTDLCHGCCLQLLRVLLWVAVFFSNIDSFPHFALIITTPCSPLTELIVRAVVVGERAGGCRRPSSVPREYVTLLDDGAPALYVKFNSSCTTPSSTYRSYDDGLLPGFASCSVDYTLILRQCRPPTQRRTRVRRNH